MLTDEEYIELVDAITKPITAQQLLHFGTVEQARAYNTEEANRAGKALLKWYAKKRGEG